jgi:tetratricopeptide (TPR) repeat protein
VARILKWADKHWEVVWMYQRAFERNPYDTLSCYNLASQYHKIKELDSALVVLDTLFKLDPAHPKANWMIGNILRRRGEHDKALIYMVRAYEFLQDNPDYVYELGVAYINAGQMAAAGGCALQVLKLNPDFIDAYHLLGAAYLADGELESARKSWEHILSVNPNDSIAMENLKHLEEMSERK